MRTIVSGSDDTNAGHLNRDTVPRKCRRELRSLRAQQPSQYASAGQQVVGPILPKSVAPASNGRFSEGIRARSSQLKIAAKGYDEINQ